MAKSAHSPVIDAGASVGDTLYRVKNGGQVVAQIGLVVESADQEQTNVMVLGALAVKRSACAEITKFGDNKQPVQLSREPTSGREIAQNPHVYIIFARDPQLKNNAPRRDDPKLTHSSYFFSTRP